MVSTYQRLTANYRLLTYCTNHKQKAGEIHSLAWMPQSSHIAFLFVFVVELADNWGRRGGDVSIGHVSGGRRRSCHCLWVIASPLQRRGVVSQRTTRLEWLWSGQGFPWLSCSSSNKSEVKIWDWVQQFDSIIAYWKHFSLLMTTNACLPFGGLKKHFWKHRSIELASKFRFRSTPAWEEILSDRAVIFAVILY